MSDTSEDREDKPLLRSRSAKQDSNKMGTPELLEIADVSDGKSEPWNFKKLVFTMKFSLSRIEYSLYLTLFLKALLPTIYSTVRVSLLGSLPSDSGVNIASQVVWLSLFFEVLQELLILPLYFTFGETIKDSSVTFNKIKTGFLVITIIFAISCGILYACIPYLVNLMAQNQDLVVETTEYVRIEIFSFFLVSLNGFLLIPIELMMMKRAIISCLLVKVVLTVIFDLTFLSNLSFSLNLGVNGVAYSNIITGFVNMIVVVIFLIRAHGPSWQQFQQHWDFVWLKTWLRLGMFSGLDSLIRNLTYMFVILRSMNLLSEAGLYWTTNTFIWSWLLLPFLPLSEVLRVDISTAQVKENHIKKMTGYLLITLFIGILWAVSIPAWNIFFSQFLNAETPDENVDLALLLFPFYLFFMFGSLVTSVMYALGKTNFIALKSIIGNLVIGILFSLTLLDVIPVDLTSVSLIFGSGLLLGFVTSCVLYIFVSKQIQYLL